MTLSGITPFDQQLITRIIFHADEEVLFRCFQVCKEWKKIVTEKVLQSIRPLFEKIGRTPFTPNDGRKYAVSLIALHRSPLFTDEYFIVQMEGPVRDLLKAFYDRSFPDFSMGNKRFFYDISRLNIERALVPVNMEIELKTGITGEAPMDHIEFLVKKSPILKVDAVKMAAQRGKLDLVRHLLNSCPISQEQSEKVVASLWEDLLRSCPNPSIRSVQNGRTDLAIIPELLARGLVSDSCRQSALQMAAYSDDLGSVRALLVNDSISDACRESVVVWAAYSGALELIKGLLVNGTISVKCQGDAVSGARLSVLTRMVAEDDAVQIIRVLLEKGPIPESIRLQEISLARWHEFNKIADLLEATQGAAQEQ